MNEKTKHFLFLYKNGYSDSPLGAIVKSGLASNLRHARGVFIRLQCDPEILKKLKKMVRFELKKSEDPVSLKEKKELLSRIIRDGTKFTEFGDLKDSKKAADAIIKLSSLDGDLKEDLKGLNGEGTSVNFNFEIVKDDKP